MGKVLPYFFSTAPLFLASKMVSGREKSQNHYYYGMLSFTDYFSCKNVRLF
jgi:hypothetical protein